MFIRSERLFLRPAWPEDWQEILDLIGDYEIVANLARAPWPYGERQAREFVAKPQEWNAPHFVVTLPDDAGSRIVGCAGFGHDGSELELGYWIGAPYKGRGYATEAARAVLRTATALGHRRVVASHFLDNQASGRVLQKAGFRATGDVIRRFSLGRGSDAPAARFEISLPGGIAMGDRAAKHPPLAA